MAHVEPGEMVIPRAMLTPEVLHLIAAEAQRRGIDPRRLMVGGQGSINPATGAEEFGFFDTVKSWFGGNSNELDMTGIDKPLKTERRYESVIEPITVSATRRNSELEFGPSASKAAFDEFIRGRSGEPNWLSKLAFPEQRSLSNPDRSSMPNSVADAARSEPSIWPGRSKIPSSVLQPARNNTYQRADSSALSTIFQPTEHIGQMMENSGIKSKQNSFYRRSYESPDVLKEYNNMSKKFQDALDKEDIAAATALYSKLRFTVLPSGIDFKPTAAPPRTPQERQDFALIQGVKLGAERNAQPANFLSEHRAWDGIRRNPDLTPVRKVSSISGIAEYDIEPSPRRAVGVDNFIGADGRVYERNASTNIPQSTGLPLLREFESGLSKLRNRAAINRGNFNHLGGEIFKAYEADDRGKLY